MLSEQPGTTAKSKVASTQETKINSKGVKDLYRKKGNQSLKTM